MKVAVIGRGFGAGAMAPAYEAQGFDVEIIPSRDGAAVAAACRGAADLISVHSPPFQHRDHVMMAIAAGKAVLCDKPFGRNADEARAMRDAALAAGIPHFLNFEFRHGAARKKAHDLIASGAIGTPVHAHYASFGSHLRNRKYGWLSDVELAGGWLGALGSHVIDAMRWTFGSEVIDCGGVLRTEIVHRPDRDGTSHQCTADDAFSVWLTFANGASATLDAASSASVNLPQRMAFLGSDGAIEIADEKIVTLTRDGQVAETFDFSPQPGDPAWPALHGWLAHVRDALETGGGLTPDFNRPDFNDGVAVADVMDKLRGPRA